MSEAQERYLAHQERKKKALLEIMLERHSERAFSDEALPLDTIQAVMAAMQTCPSSCDRKGVGIEVVEGRDQKALLGGLLVGGVGWIHRAPVVLLLFGQAESYKADGEIAFMPYLDAGAMMYAAYLHATANDLACCFCNPNIRPMNREHFQTLFGEGVFCGAIALGFPRKTN